MTIDPAIKALIKRHLRELERTNDVTILAAVESGSRAWDFASPNSDYDIRFIYRRTRSQYLSLEYTREDEVIEYATDPKLDFSGWDIRKALKLASCSNPSIAEWSVSPIVYADLFFLDELRKTIRKHYSFDTAIRAYHSMARGNYFKYLSGRETISYKRLLYVLRPLFVIRWINERKTMPPMQFPFLLYNLDSKLEDEINTLLAAKRSGEEMGQGPMSKYPHIAAYMQHQVERIPGPRPQFDSTFASITDFNELLLQYI